MNAHTVQVLVTLDEQEQERLRAIARGRQRRRRMGLQRRIDYTPDAHAGTVIDSLRTGYAGGDASSIINRIIAEWAAHRPDAGGRPLHAAGPDPAALPAAVKPGSHAAWGEAV